MPRVLLLLPTTTYRGTDFLRAAGEVGAEVTVASEEASAVAHLNPAGLLTLDFRDPEGSARRILEASRVTPFAAVVGVDEATSAVAAKASSLLGLPHNPPQAAADAANKGRMRARLESAGLPGPRCRLFHAGDDPGAAARSVGYPCVVKPTILSGSRGVIRASGPEELVAAWRRLRAILADPEVARRGTEASEILVEDFVPGPEVALEGLLQGGRLRTLALFDKPDPLEGPFFEETIYVTPSRLPGPAQAAVVDAASRAAAALGLTEGPVHAELRWGGSRATVIEIAARSIGGLCGRTLRFGTGQSLEQLILRHALGLPAGAERERGAAGVMMIPIPRAGIYEGVEGGDAALAVPGVEDVTITAHPGQRLVPLPEGSRYLGFIFARGETPDDAEMALREAHRKLRFLIRE